MLALREWHSLACGSQMPRMPTVAEFRHANLLRLIGEGHGSIQRFADSIGRSHAQVSQLKNQNKHSGSGERRGMGDDMARHIEKARGLPEGWMDQPHDPDATEVTIHQSVRGVAHDMDQARNYPALQRFQWRDLMGANLDQPFELDVLDDALAPEITRGCVVRLDPAREPRPGQPVLVRDSNGQHYLRDYQRAGGDRWQAVARARGFAPLDSINDGLQLIAAVKGVDWP